MTAGCFYQNYREVRLLIIHCSATRYDRDFPVEALRASHKARGFADIGYHFYITRDGYLHRCRPVNQKCSLLDLLRQLRRDYPEAKIVGHCQLSPYIRKACPCFDAREEYAGLEEEVSRK